MGVSAPWPATPTRFASLSRTRAAGVAAATLVAMVWLLRGATPAPARPDGAGARDVSQENDVAFYKAVVARVRAGQGYYDAVGPELRARHYPLRPAFAWRQPTYAWVLARLPSPAWGSAVLAVLGAAVVLLTMRWARASAFGRALPLASGLFIVTMAGSLVGDFVYLQEAWAGSLVALSLAFYANDRWPPAVAAGLAALAFREFALLPCGVALLFALRARRWGEVRAWVVGLAVYAGLLTWHLLEVARHVLPSDLSRGWLALGGSSFVLEMCRWNPLLLLLPKVVVACVLPFILLGLVGWRDSVGARLAIIVFGYLAIFSVVGHSFNDYWGATFAPLLTFGLIAAPASVRDLGRALSRDAPGPRPRGVS
ncbi:MAG: hypothetical protein JWM82_722 [Myxococcales bacterium]|nr:hypothetical protein [Myxococcales bacterium]